MKWTPEETALLLELNQELTLPEIAQRLGRSYNTVLLKVKRMKLPFNRTCQVYERKLWTESEESMLLQWAGEVPLGEIARRLGRNKNSVTLKALRLGITLTTELDSWSGFQFTQLTGIPNATLRGWIDKGHLKAQKTGHFKRSRYVITRQNFREFYQQYGHKYPSLQFIPDEVLEWLLEEPTIEPSHEKPGYQFSQEEDDTIRRYAGFLSRAELADLLGRSEDAIRNRAYRLKVKLRVYR